MAKEMMIIFVYDIKLLQNEDDDPASAILYFHPGWVSDQQRTALCGQIIGACHFLRTAFKCPRIFALQSGKFSIRTYGRYILAVGTDRNIADWVLEHRADTLSALVTFFHHDLEKLLELYPDQTKLSAKLYHMFETYLKILMYGGHMFFNIPTIQLPKSASHVFLEAMHLLQHCQQINCVLGGTILYHNKVVATQLSSDLTKQLVLTDPYRIKSPAEAFMIEFSLPLGVQLLQVYICHEEYSNLYEDSLKFRSIPQYLNKINMKKQTTSKANPLLSTIKRDQSIIFTTVPEEDTDQHLEEPIKNIKSPDRPKFLNLKSKTTDAKFEIKPDPIPSTSFHAQTSICSTPMTDLNKVLHQNIMSICVDPKDKVMPKKNLPELEPIGNNTRNSHDRKRSSSMWEFRERLKIFNKRITMRYYNTHLPNLECDLELEDVPKDFGYRTIADPTFPIIKSNGLAVSRYLYSQYTHEPLKKIAVEKPPSKVVQKPIAPTSKETRKGLSLPLKSLTSDQPENMFMRPSGGVQLTPLMSRLSLLAMEERSSGFCSRDATPTEHKIAAFTPNQSTYSFLRRKSSVFEEVVDKTASNLHEAVLFVCGQQDMVMGLLLDEGVRNSPDTINQLWEICTESLGKLERQLRHSLEVYPASSGESYSYLCMDPQWDNVRRGGPWGATELAVLTHFHRDFINMKNLTEIILRNDESIIYGHHCGKTEVFYHQVASSTAGLPTPADLMGTVSLKARRRLERDHAIILL